MNKNKNTTIMYCYRCKKCTMMWNGFVGMKNERGNYLHCYSCSSPSVKFFHIDNGKITTEEPPTENAIVLSEENVPANVPHGEVLSELYAIRSAMAMISENICEIECEEKFFLKAYRDEYQFGFAEKAWKQYMGTWERYLVPNLLLQYQESINKAELDSKTLRNQLENVKNRKVGFFQLLKKRAQIKRLKKELEDKARKIEELKTKMAVVQEGATNTNNSGFLHCKFEFPWDSFPEKVYYLMAIPLIDNRFACRRDESSLSFYLGKARNDKSEPQGLSDIIEYMTQEEKDNLQKEREERVEESKMILEAAQKAYQIIDFRDWKNVDLLIYYFETGRADNLKEALQLVDRQLQTNQIVEAINMASAEIGKTIRQSMEALGGALAQSFSLLSAQIQRQSQEMKDAVGQQTAAINKFGAAQISNQRMANALLANIDKSSAKLAEDMDRQMKEVYHLY